MRIILKIFIIISLTICGLSSYAQDVSEQEKNRDGNEEMTASANGQQADETDAGEKARVRNQNAETKSGTVKHVKSARPDMSRSRGARPPDVVRPSGSRIPKGVGRPAGALKHGR